MTICSTPGCQNPVSKPGHTLCYACWKTSHQPVQVSQTSSKVNPVKVNPVKVNPVKANPVKVNTVAEPTATYDSSAELLSTTRIGKQLGVSRFRVNPLLAELGLLDKTENGWVATKRGLALGAQQQLSSRGGSQYVLWPSELLTNTVFIQSIRLLGDSNPPPETTEEPPGFREKFQEGAKYRTNDGHWVRSRAEVIIDNWLYFAGLVHAYERKLPVDAEKDAYCDFYIPQGRIYIEFWGYENDAQYLARKREKQALYEANGLNLIELSDQHIQQLDDYLPTMLSKFGIKNLG